MDPGAWNGRVCRDPVDSAAGGRNFHRPFSGVHLPAAWNGLFQVAADHFSAVIYIIITRQMEKLDNTQGNKSRIRSFLTAAGLVTAIIGSLVLLRDLNAVETSISSPIKTSKIINSDLLIHAASTAWSLEQSSITSFPTPPCLYPYRSCGFL